MQPEAFMQTDYSSDARIVIIGSGVVGAAIADELTQRGADNVTVLDQGPLYDVGGSSSHATGFVFQINPSKAMCELAEPTLKKLDTLDSRTEDDWMLKDVGSAELTYTCEQVRELIRRHGFAQARGVESELIGPSRTKELWPSLDTSELVGALHTPTDGIVHSVRAITAQAQRAIAHGA